MKTILFDTHTHINLEQFDADREQVLIQAKAAGIGYMLIPGIDLSSSEAIVSWINERTGIFAAVGTHPNSALETPFFNEHIAQKMVQHQAVVAIGEIGLDYYWDHVPHDIQQECFRTWLNFAHECALPAIIHMRNAYADTLKTVKDCHRSGYQAVMHCFSGTCEQAQAFLDLGYLISFAGQITYKNAYDLRKVVQYVPLDRLLIETDAPYLPPTPFRGKRNEPAYIVNTAEKIAELKHISFEEVAQQTTMNAKGVFGIP